MSNANLRFNRDEIKDELQLSGKVSRGITPTPNFLTILESSGYLPYEAINDITDNSIDAEATKIKTYFGTENKKPYIIIGDNGSGMEGDTLFGSLVIGASDWELGDYVKNGGSLGKYGTGMKSSILSLKGVAIILTKTKDGELLKTTYDKNTISDYYHTHGEWGLSIELATDDQDIELFEEYTDGSEYGTVIKIYNIERYKDVQSIRNTMIKTYSRYFQRFIIDGVEFSVNGTILEPTDLCGSEVPFTLNKESHSSTQMGTDIVWDNLTYTDKNKVTHKDGYLRYRAFLLPQENVISESAWNDKFDWNLKNQGICVYRGNRLIQSRGWFGLIQKADRLKRFRVELDFNGDLDVLMNVDFKKTKVNPDGYILKELDDILRRDISLASQEFYKNSPKGKKIAKSLKQLAKRFGQWAKNNTNRLPKIPGTPSGNIYTNKKPKVRISKKTGKPMVTLGDRLRFIYDDSITDGSFYKTETGPTRNCVDIRWNMDHIMFKDFVENSDIATLAPIVCMIWAEHYGKEYNKPESTASALDEYNQRWDEIQQDKGRWLTKMYPTAPKV